jgi:peptidoglycan/xylan/chitin deacetylase (PgdA/CDA1 family)
MRISRLVKSVLFYAGIFALIRILKPNNRVAILRYHAIVDAHENFYANPSICLSRKQFEKHVAYFSRRYNVLSLDTVVAAWRAGKPLPPNAIVFSFDDGYADNFFAAEILKKYGATGTFYLTAACVDRKEPFWLSEVIYYLLKTEKQEFTIQAPGDEIMKFSLHANGAIRWQAIEKLVAIIKSNNKSVREKIRNQIRAQLDDVQFEDIADKIMLDWQQVRRMCKSGMTIGAHTMTHLNLPNAGAQDTWAEISDCKALLEEKVQQKILHFSYPNSGPYEYYTEKIRNLVEACGYQSSATSFAGFAGPESDRFALKRVRTVASLVERVAGLEWDRSFG